MVNFAGLEFIFRFLPVFLVIYYIFSEKYRDTILLLGSLLFYAAGEPRFFLLFIALTGINYLMGRKGNQDIQSFAMHKWQKRRRKKWMITAVTLDILVLIAFKCLSTFVDSTLLPMGLSFYLFKMISWQVDMYRSVIAEDVSFRSVALYFSLFPQVVSGPIMRYDDGDFALGRTYSPERFEKGLFFFISGLGMKVLLADRLAILWNDLQMIGFQSISTPLAWLGAYSYSLQLYFDFWGYSLMASGIMMMLGFDFIENFNHPYASKSIGEFYRRWHITLGNFFRDYVYIPMGGSRCSDGKLALNLAFVWILTGIWHGNGLNFIIWGAILGLLIISEKLIYGKLLAKVPLIGHLYVLLLVPLTWVVFAITDLGQLAVYFGRLFPFIGGFGLAVNEMDIVKYSQMYGPLIILGMILCIPKVCGQISKHRNHPFVLLGLTVVFWWSIYYLSNNAGNPFMYFAF